jgi:hypothetical protein
MNTYPATIIVRNPQGGIISSFVTSLSGDTPQEAATRAMEQGSVFLVEKATIEVQFKMWN